MSSSMPRHRRDKIFEAIRLLLVTESQKKSLVMIIEDLHWMDKTSEEFFTYLISSLATTRIMLIILFRPEYNPAAWVTKTYYSQVRGGPASQEDHRRPCEGYLCGMR